MQINVKDHPTKIHTGTNAVSALIFHNESDTNIRVDTDPDVADSGAKAGIIIKPNEQLIIAAGTVINYQVNVDWYAIHGGSGDKMLNVNTK
jgi:hypothetical protein